MTFTKIKFSEWIPYGSGITLSKASPDKKYIKTLSKCLNFTTAADIYPGVKHPLSHELHTLWKLGLIDKFINAENKKDRHVYYKLTNKGWNFLYNIYNNKNSAVVQK